MTSCDHVFLSFFSIFGVISVKLLETKMEGRLGVMLKADQQHLGSIFCWLSGWVNL